MLRVPSLPLPGHLAGGIVWRVRHAPHLRVLLAGVLVVLGTGLAGPLLGQGQGQGQGQPSQGQVGEGSPPLQLTIQGESREVRVVMGSFLASEGVQSSLRSGLPIRIQVVTELWRVRTFDALEGRHEWRATVRLDPLTGQYMLESSQGGDGTASSADAARVFLQNRLVPRLAPAREGRFYYISRIEVETLSLTDLEELRRWLRGDVGAAVGGQEEVGSVLGRGLRRLLVRALRLPVQRYETRTVTFEHPG